MAIIAHMKMIHAELYGDDKMHVDDETYGDEKFNYNSKVGICELHDDNEAYDYYGAREEK
eukprot:2920634-Ditylum_brightwellii.AAC.1